ncbi:cytochrome-c peroxidase [Luteolibacter sp. Populi]|uniref:cytochrome-c peroxidase n=1 Tax=Luteolibacter sp. Populi TaxID=3230487 RepID=UPI003466DB41
MNRRNGILGAPVRPRLAAVCLSFAAAVMAIAEGSDEARQAQAAAALLGREIFLDAGLSNPSGMSCSSCHLPEAGFGDPRAVSPGAVLGRNGRRNAPSLMYAALIPNRDQEDILEESGEQIWVWQGGLFQDGSARTLHEQVQRPFFDHAEMNLASASDLAARLRKADYAVSMKHGLTEAEWADDGKLAERAYRALVEFLKEPMFRPFDARIDDYFAGNQEALSPAEKRGLEIFKGKAKCADCHLLQASAWPRPLLSDFGYDNLGAPARGVKDPGLGGHTGVAEELGQFRAPTLRNVALTAPYLHNGSIATLREVVEFYNKRDIEPERWGQTDYPQTVNRDDLGNLGLSEAEVDDLTALMDAFTDRSLLEMQKRGDRFPAAPIGTPDSWKMRAYFPDWNHAAPPLPAHPPRPADPEPKLSNQP